MTIYSVRRLLVDLKTPFPTRWNGGDAFSSALFNALSMSFPVGEQFFIDSLRGGIATLDETTKAKFAQELQGFVGQEATHRHIHQQFNQQLIQLGLRNVIEQRTQARVLANAKVNIKQQVGATAATEHFTAMLAQWLLRRTDVLAGAPERLQTLWLWHSSEELEHRSTAFDIYRAMGGNERWRKLSYYYVTATFLTDLIRQVVRNLWQDKALFARSTWRSAFKLLFSQDGMVRGNYAVWKAYLAADFHPSKHDDQLAKNWLTQHQADFKVVGER